MPVAQNGMMDFLFKKVNIASLIFFRIVFGFLGFADVLGSWIGKHFIEKALNPENFQFKYYGFQWVNTFPDPFLSFIFILTMFAGLGIALGKWYRWSAFVFALGFSYIFFVEKAYYLNHGYLTMLISWLIIFMPLDRNYSMDVIRNPEIRKTTVPYWSLFMLQFLMGVVYFFGGIAKLNSDWLNGMPLKLWLNYKSDMPILGYFWQQEWVAYAMSYGGLFLDLFVVFFLLIKRTRIWALCFVLFFHLNNLILFLIGIFPFLSVTLTLMYFEPDFPIRAWKWIESRFSKLKILSVRWNSWFVNETESSLVYAPSERLWIKISTSIIILTMILIPLRHHLFEGNVAWTEEGHRYSWRMMLRQKQAYGDFVVKNLNTNTIEKVKPSDYLTKRQTRKLYTHPDMILQFAHFLRDKYETEYKAEVAIFANIRSKLNGRKYQVYVDPNIDLAKEEWHFFKHAAWIVPLENADGMQKEK